MKDMFEKRGLEQREHERIDTNRGRDLYNVLAKQSCLESMECMQGACNEVFTTKRREGMIKSASVDRKGRKVRYYRMIQKNIFLRMLNEGEHSIENNHLEDFDRIVSERKVYDFFYWYIVRSSDDIDIEDEIEDSSLKELLDRITDNEEEKESLLRERTNRSVVGFIQKYCDSRIIEQIHAGSVYPEFSPYLSISVGGSPMKRIHEDCIMLELILPDEKVSSYPSETASRQGEKHAYVLRGFSLDTVSRVFVSSTQYRDEVLNDESVPVGEWRTQREGKNSLEKYHDWVEDWRWKESTDDCLPVGILNRYGIKK